MGPYPLPACDQNTASERKCPAGPACRPRSLRSPKCPRHGGDGGGVDAITCPPARTAPLRKWLVRPVTHGETELLVDAPLQFLRVRRARPFRVRRAIPSPAPPTQHAADRT